MSFNVWSQQDSILVEARREFDADKIVTFRGDPDFDYLEQKDGSRWLAGLGEWLANKLAYFFRDNDPNEIINWLAIIFRIITWGLLIFALSMIAISLYKRGMIGVISKKSQKLDLDFTELEENVLETDWQALIDESLAEGRYNITIRLMYLQLLQLLNTAQIIRWDKAKTIRDYQREINLEHREDFVNLSRYYQYVWFGEIDIDERHFGQLQAAFISYKQKLNVA